MAYVRNSLTIISKSRVFPNQMSKLSVSDLPVLSCHDIQKGCLFTLPHLPPDALLPHFKHTLSLTLSHFLPLAGRLSTSDDGYVFLSCNDVGADFVFADAKTVHVSDVIAGIDVPEFFSYDMAVSCEEHTRTILAVQVTELIAGVFIVCSVNHALADDMLWNFINTFAEMSGVDILTRPAEVLPPPLSPSPPSSLPQRQPSNTLLNVAPSHPMNLINQVPEPHQMELIDGAFIVCFVNHAVSTSLWNSMDTFAEMSGVEILTRPAEVLPPPPSPSPSPSPSPPLPPPPSRIPQRQPSNPFLNVAPPYPMNLTNQVPEPHQMDKLTWTALGYCFTAGLAFNSIVAQVGNPNNVSFRVQLLSVLLKIALYLLIAANGIFARTHPRIAFVMDRAGSVIVLISSIIAATPTFSEYVSIGCAVIMIILYAHQYFSS